MENWRLKKDKSASSTRRGSGIQIGLHRVASEGGGQAKHNAADFWDKDVTHDRRWSDWQNQKPMPSIPSQRVSVYSIGQDEEPLRSSLTVLELASSGRNVGGLSEAAVAEQLAKEAALENRECFAEDVVRVWDEISHFIINHIKSGYGVQIPGLCTITIQDERKAVADSPFFEMRRSPLMVLSTAVVHLYKLANFDEYTYNYKFSSVPLNLTDIAKKLQAPRRIIEGAMTEVLQSFARAVVCGKRVEFPFSRIGKLQIKDRVAKMRFYDEFCAKVGLDVPVSNTNPPKELIPDYIKEQAPSLLQDSSDPDENTLPGHMTPLRKHIPSESFRSVFHLREVRSVHDGQLLVSTEVKEETEQKQEAAEESINGDKGPIFGSLSETKNIFEPGSERKNDSNSLLYENFDRILEEIEAEERLNFEPHPHDMEYGQFMESKKVSITGGEPGSELQPERKPPKFEAPPLYHRRSVTGKYGIDVIRVTPAVFKESLQAHHYAITTKVLGPEVVKEHLARRGRIRNPPLSYDDKRFNPPSPQ